MRIEYIPSLGKYHRHELDALICSGKLKSNVKRHLVDMVTYIHHKNETPACLIRTDDERIVGGAIFYCKNRNKLESTSSLYNLFSTQPGCGRLAFQFYWDWSIQQGARWYKFYADLGAYNFYKKFDVKYYGVSKTGQTLSSMGLIYSNDICASMQMWQKNIYDLSTKDREYLEKNLKEFNKKHICGITKLKKSYQYIMSEAIISYNLQQEAVLPEDVFL